MYHEWGRREIPTEFLFGHPKQKYSSENIGLHGTMILKWIK